jgi:hypothetical protein
MVALAMSSVLASGRIGGAPGRAAHALLSGLWLGLLSEHQLTELDERYYEIDTTYRSAAWNERGLWGWEQQAVARCFAPGSRIVVPGCGGGREVLALLEQGFDAVGYEPHVALQSYAAGFLAGRGHPGRAMPCPRDRFPAGERCAGVLVGWGAYSLIAPRSRRVAFLTEAAAALERPGGLILSCFERSGRGWGLKLAAGLASALRRIRRLPPVERGDALAPNRVHVFERSELASELLDAGFSPESLSAVAPAAPGVRYTRAICRLA